MQTAITFGTLPDGAIEVLSGTKVPIPAQVRAFMALKAQPIPERFVKVQMWDSDHGQIPGRIILPRKVAAPEPEPEKVDGDKKPEDAKPEDTTKPKPAPKKAAAAKV